jgi:dephospho-CoA kinase
MSLQVGVTGGIGSGKSVVCQLFACLGVPIYNADSRAKWLTNNDPVIRENVTDLLGSKAYDEAGIYNTSYVSSRVFQDESLLKQLNTIIHPVVMQDTLNWVQSNQASPYVVKEAAIMNKAGDKNSLNLRIKRILQRDNRTKEQISAIIQRQVSDDERRKIADFLIFNDEESALIPQVLKLHEIFKLGKKAV